MCIRDRLWGWGENSNHQIDNTNNRYYAYPVQIDLGDEFNGHILRTYDGLYHVVAMLDNGRIISWGANSEGQLGQGIAAVSYTHLDVYKRQGSI